MVGELRRERVDGEFVGVDACFDQLGGVLPDRVVTRHEYDTPLLKGGNGVVGCGIDAFGVLVVVRIGAGRRAFQDEGVRLEAFA
jgi:hypothetical protein